MADKTKTTEADEGAREVTPKNPHGDFRPDGKLIGDPSGTQTRGPQRPPETFRPSEK